MAAIEKPVMVVGIDDSEHIFYALEWPLDHLLTPSAPNSPFKLDIVHCKPSAISAVGFVGHGAVDVLPHVESDLKKIVARVIGTKPRHHCLLIGEVNPVLVRTWTVSGDFCRL